MQTLSVNFSFRHSDHACCLLGPSILLPCRYRQIQSAYILSEYFAKSYFNKFWTEIHDVTTILKRDVCSFISDHSVQIAVGTRVETPQNSYIAQIPGHTNYARPVRQPFPSNTGLRFSREMAVATIGPFQMLRTLCVIDTNFTFLWHFLLKLWRNEILR
jgi:hypothetical protein